MRLPFAVLLFSPAVVLAATPCAPRHLQLDLAGVRGVQVMVNSHDLHVHGGGDGGLVVDGRACASQASSLPALQITHRRDGDQLIVEMVDTGHAGFSLPGGTQRALEATVSLPANLPLRVDVGSGDADVRDVRQVHGVVGSGDLRASGVAMLQVSVGSGDVDATDVGSLDVGSVGSGDVRAQKVGGDVRIGSIGSGDVMLREVGGSVRADTLGSGDLNVTDVSGGLSLGAKGSGDVGHSHVKGKIELPRGADD